MRHRFVWLVGFAVAMGLPGLSVEAQAAQGSSGLVSCGAVVCRDGEVCCNESCGICAPPDGSCSQQVCTPAPPCVDNVLCIRGLHWSPILCQCVPDDEGLCSNDSDCRLFDDTCNSCDCRALSTADIDPTCSGPGVACFAAPCINKIAVCVDGQCTARCVQIALCAVTAHWDTALCQCVPNRPRRPHLPHVPHLPHAPHQPHEPDSLG